MSSPEHDIEKILGPDIAEVSQSAYTAKSRTERRIELESAGIIFPSLETEWSVLMQKARAAQRRGSPMLAEDGSVILPEGEFQPLSHSQRLEQHNEERLKKNVQV